MEAILYAFGFVVAAQLPVAAGNTDFAVEGVHWETSYNGQVCGRDSVISDSSGVEGVQDQIYTGCSVGYFVTSNITSQVGWEGTIQDSANIDSIRDTEFSNRILFHYFENTPNDTVQVDAQDLGGPNAQGFTILGQAGYSATNGWMLTASVTMNKNGSISWNVYANCACGPSSFEIDLLTVGEHELGHALGLGHPTQGPSSGNVMECFINKGEQLFGDPYTSNGIKYLYDWDYLGPGPVAQPC